MKLTFSSDFQTVLTEFHLLERLQLTTSWDLNLNFDPDQRHTKMAIFELQLHQILHHFRQFD